MGQRGPAKVPAKTKQQRGTYRKDRDGDPDLAAKTVDITEVPQPPDCLKDEGRKRWNEAATKLIECGLLTTLDLDALECYCRAWDVLAECVKILDTHGVETFYQTNSGSIRPHPAINRAATAEQTILRYQQQLGMTPSARTGLQVSAQLAKAAGVSSRARRR